MSGKISADPSAAPVAGTDVIPIVRGINNLKATLDNLLAYFLNGATPTEAGYLQGATSNIQDQLDQLALDVAAAQASAASKADIEWDSRGNGGAISYHKNGRYGSISSPVIANISYDNTLSPRNGVECLIIHNHSSAPAFSGQYQAASDSAAYQTGQVNYIRCIMVDAAGGPRIKYKIYQ